MSPTSSLDLFRSECAAPFPRGPETGGEKDEFADPIQAFRRLLAEMMTISADAPTSIMPILRAYRGLYPTYV